MPLALPPYCEQAAILNVIEASEVWLQDAALLTKREIALLREYRTRLIADVVTGKLDVREAAAILPDETNEQEEFAGAVVITDGDEAAGDANLEVTVEEAEA